MTYTESQVIYSQVNGENDAVQGLEPQDTCSIYLDAYYNTRVAIQKGELTAIQAIQAQETKRALDSLNDDWEFDVF